MPKKDPPKPTPATRTRPLTVVVKVNDEEYLALDKQADIQGVTRSDVLRGFVRGLPTFSGNATRRDA